MTGRVGPDQWLANCKEPIFTKSVHFTEKWTERVVVTEKMDLLDLCGLGEPGHLTQPVTCMGLTAQQWRKKMATNTIATQ